ncbi:MAG: hypothetical protein PF518_13075 [Spirochaetaceae bacterium]|jgi:hypothetical protein|nr:hypothetical protein [Spirochaetaceae bacterium]
MFKRYSFLFIFSLMLLPALQAFDANETLSYLGATISEIFEYPVIPEEIYPNRGIEEDEDNVIFYYSNGFYLFLFENRVWQVRYDRNYKEAILDLKMENTMVQILADKLEEGITPLFSGDNYLTFQIAESPYPVRMKLFFTDDKLDDLYIFRADF